MFKSLNGTGCLVNIYDEGYTSSADETKTGADIPFAAEQGVTLLTGAAVPFSYDEDDDADLLNTVRFKTGNIKVIETTFGSLSDLAPETSTSHYVEFFYGSRLDFTGYMQAQSFESGWCAPPRELSFPVVSPLGLMDGMRLGDINPPVRVTIASLLKEVAEGLGAAYTRVIFPNVDTGLEGKLNSLVVSPLSGDYSQSAYIHNEPFAPITYHEFVEGICNCFGWMAHDTPDAIMFSMYDFGGQYAAYTIADLATLANKTLVGVSGAYVSDFSLHSSVAGNDGKVSSILPYSRIKLDFGGEYKTSAEFDFSRMKFHRESHYSNIHVGWFRCEDGSVTGDYLSETGDYINPTNGRISHPGAYICEYGNPSETSQGFVVKMDTAWPNDTALFQVNFAEPPANGFSVDYEAKFGNLLSEMKAADDEDVLTHYNVGYLVKVGDKYYHGNGQWSTSVPVPFPNSGWEVTNVPKGETIEIIFGFGYPGTPEAELIAISGLKLSELRGEMFDKYKQVAERNIINGSAGSYDEGSVSMLFTVSKQGTNLVGTQVVGLPTLYPYLRTAQTRVQAPFRISDMPTLPYARMFMYWLTNYRWRLIALSFSPRDDEYRATLHRSACLEDIHAEYTVVVHGDVTHNAPMRIPEGNYVQFSLVPDDGFSLGAVTVLMGGVDITADCYDDGVISIEHVTGNILVEEDVVINFADANVKSLCVANWGDNAVPDEITKSEAAAVTSLGGVFKENTQITSFNELKYFTGLTSLTISGIAATAIGAFYGCTNLENVTIPKAPITNFAGAFRQCLKIRFLDLTPTTADGINISALTRYTAGGILPTYDTEYLTEVRLPGGNYRRDWYQPFNRRRALQKIAIDGVADLSGLDGTSNDYYAAFSNCIALTTITGRIVGISHNISLQYSPLDVASATMIVNALSSSASGKTLTLMSSMQATYEANADFVAAVAAKSNWTITYA